MSNHSTQNRIDLHHSQKESARLRKMKREYEREYKKEIQRREMRKFGIAWEVLKGVIVACLFTSLISSVIYCLYSLFGGL